VAVRYSVDALVEGFPGKATAHGGPGWSGITLLRGADRVVLVDTGGFGVRDPLARALAERGVAPGDVTDVLLTHVHYDHAVNALLFPEAALWISEADLAWARERRPGLDPVPELYARSSTATRARGGSTPTARCCPASTPSPRPVTRPAASSIASRPTTAW